MKMTDIANRKDIETLIDTFYKKVINDDLISVFFTETVELDWKIHIPIMYNHWESVLFGNATYKGNPMIKHIELNAKKHLEPEHFDRWLTIWRNTIQENFSGKNADEAIQKAENIAELMKYKIYQTSNH